MCNKTKKDIINIILLVFILTFISDAIYATVQRENPQSRVILKPRDKDYNQVEFMENNGEWIITTKGHDPFIFFDALVPVNFDKQYILSLESFNTTESLPLVIFVGDQLDWDHLAEGYVLPRTEGWAFNGYDLSVIKKAPSNPFTSVRIRFGLSEGKTLRIRNVQLREPTEHEKDMAAHKESRYKQDEVKASRLKEYLNRTFDSEITSIKASYKKGQIEISGKLKEPVSENIGLAEVPLWEDVTDLCNPASFIPLKESSFSCVIDRVASDNDDRLLSGWAIVRKENDSKYELLSALHYIDNIEPRENLEKKTPRSLKGLGGCPFDHPDMTELGIASVTFNIILDQILFVENKLGYKPYVYGGKTWYVDTQGALKGIDKKVKIAHEYGWMVSAILLIPVNRTGEKDSWLGQVAHPDALMSAAFAMPDMTSKEAVEAYAAAINFLAERYSTPEYGRIHHWIIHNEIQNGFYWTSAGNKKIETYMNLYQKSMRLVHTLVRQYDPNAKALISLDHDWMITGDMRGYKGRDLLELLVDFSNKEGNFEWGIAHHPYPQDINNPRTWEDDKAVFSFETPYLTPKNLEVLDAWASQEKVLFRGKPREIQFTEQGLNSPDYSPTSLIDQAAGMAYTWEKLKGLKNATAYQYHLWADAYEEGGLKLGLRKYHDAEGDPHGKKPIWHLYRALETAESKKASDPYKQVIGINSWDGVRYEGEILFSCSQDINTLTKKEKKDGWQLLFDGKTTQGWHSFNQKEALSPWEVRHGELSLQIIKEGERGWDLVTDEEFENFDLRLEWKISKGGNSGIFFGVQEGLQYGWASSTGIEMQILDNIDGADRHNPTHLAGAMYDLVDATETSKPKPVGEWNQVRILKNNEEVIFWLNGIITAKINMDSPEWIKMVRNSKWNGADQYNGADFGKFSKGKIALQDHFDVVYFRNIKIKKL